MSTLDTPPQPPPAAADPGEPAPASEPASDPAPVSAALAAVADLAVNLGEPLSVTVTEAVREVHVHLAAAAGLDGWAQALGGGEIRRRRDELCGRVARVSGPLVPGWTAHARFVGDEAVA